MELQEPQENENQEHVEESEEDTIKEAILEPPTQEKTEITDNVEEIKEEDKFLEPVEFEIDLEKFEPSVKFKEKTMMFIMKCIVMH